jgi:hypothetical protein
MKSLKVLMCVDFMSCDMYDNDVQKEYDAIEVEIRELFPNFEINFEREVYPNKLANASFDIYLFDYGGMMPGCGGLISSLFKEFGKQAEDHPNSVFLLYSSFSEQFYEDAMREDFEGNFEPQHNVVYASTLKYEEGDESCAKKCLQILGV